MTSGGEARGRALPTVPDDRRLELIGFAAILALAAVLRLGNLAVRGTWDADQGHDMLVLRAFVLDGRIPLLGPPTSIGDFHHGVLYYLLLAPAAAVSGGDPVAVTTWIALGGVAAVAVTGWLARSIAGPAAGLLAALLLAVSASAVDESIFIWNPNLIALTSSIALAAAWRAWQGRRVRWWLVAGAAAVLTMHCHVLGVILTPVVAGLLVADVRRRRLAGDGAGVSAVSRAAIGWVAIAVVSYLPLALHELGSRGEELLAAATYLTSGGGPTGIALPARIPIVALRVLGWPLTGLLTSAPIATLVSTFLVVILAVWRGWLDRPSDQPGRMQPHDERLAVRWLAMGLLWTVLALAVGAGSLATVIPGLPNDHYHAFADPMVVVLVTIALAALIRRAMDRATSRGTPAGVRLAGAAAAAIVVGLVAWNLVHQPPGVAADGGWQAARTAADRVIAEGGSGPLVLSSQPSFKSDEALRMPLGAAGAELVPAGANGGAFGGPDATRVIVCDQLFRDAIGADCGGPAEDAWLANPASGLAPAPVQATRFKLASRFEAAPGRWVSIYRP